MRGISSPRRRWTSTRFISRAGVSGSSGGAPAGSDGRAVVAPADGGGPTPPRSPAGAARGARRRARGPRRPRPPTRAARRRRSRRRPRRASSRPTSGWHSTARASFRRRPRPRRGPAARAKERPRSGGGRLGRPGGEGEQEERAACIWGATLADPDTAVNGSAAVLDSALACSRCSPRDRAHRPSGSEPGSAPSSPPRGPAASWPSPSRCGSSTGSSRSAAGPCRARSARPRASSSRSSPSGWPGAASAGSRTACSGASGPSSSSRTSSSPSSRSSCLTLFMAVAIVLLLGLTASRVVTGEIDRAGDVLCSTARSALAGLPAGGRATRPRALPARLAAAREVHPGVSWTLLRGGRVAASSGDAPRALPPWWKGPGFAGLVRLHPEEKLSAEALRAAWAEGDSALVLDAPADEAFYADLERRTGIHVLQRSEMEVEPADAPRRRGRVSEGHGRHLRGGRPARHGAAPVLVPVRGASREDGLDDRRERARSTGCRSRSSTSLGPSCGGCRPSSCRATRAGGACRTCCST